MRQRISGPALAGQRRASARAMRAFGCLLMLVLLASCAVDTASDWPQSLPPRHLFVAAYEADADNQLRQTRQEYLDWIVTFYQGSMLYRTGWENVEGLVLAQSEQGQRAQIIRELRQMGIAVGSEWAKDNEVRLIDNRLLSLWGYLLQLAEDGETQVHYMAVIGEDIDALLRRQLEPTMIAESRYEELLEIQLFEGF